TSSDWVCLVYLLILIPVLAVAMLPNQQIFNAYRVWGDQKFYLRLLNNTSSWLITVDAAVSFTMLVAVAAFWKWYGTRRREPDEISKMIIGSIFTVAGGLCLFMAALTQPHGGKISLLWPMLFELCNSAPGRSLQQRGLTLRPKDWVMRSRPSARSSRAAISARRGKHCSRTPAAAPAASSTGLAPRPCSARGRSTRRSCSSASSRA